MLGKKVNILVLTLLTLLSTATFAAVHTQYSSTVCSNTPYLFGCDKLTTSGAYSQTLVDSTVTVNLLFGALKATAYTATIEPGQTYLFGCQKLTADATETNTLQQVGCECDSTVTLTLTVQAPAPTPTSVTVAYTANIYDGETYLFGCQKLTAAGPYTETFQRVGGGDSIVNLTLNVNAAPVQKVTVEYNTEIEVGQTYLFGCKTYTYTETGPQTLKDSVQAVNGGDSIIIVHLTVSAGGAAKKDTVVGYTTSIYTGQTYLFGCQKLTTAGVYKDALPRLGVIGDSITVLTLNVQAQDTAVAYTAIIKQGQTYLFGCQKLTAAGPYTNTIPRVGVAGDSIINLTLDVLATTYCDTTITTCDSLVWIHETIKTSGEYIDTIPNVAGGDSIITLHLTVNYATTGSETVSACGDYLWHGKVYNLSGIYVDTLSSLVTGCDSIVTLNLTINQPVYGPTQTVTGCDSVIYKGIKYTASTQIEDTLDIPASNGCDSILIVNIIVNQHATGVDALEGCDAVVFKGITYTADAVVYDTLTAASGCDSIVAVTITVKHHATGVDALEGCDSVVFKGIKYTSDAVVYDTLTAANQCDSIVTVTITVNHTDSSTVDVIDTCNMYTWHGSLYTSPGVYYDTLQTAAGCDSICKLDLTIVLPYQDTLTIEHYYGDRIIMINRHEINALGWKLDSLDLDHPEYVKWYRIEASGDTTFLGDGYYYTIASGDPIPVGTYFAVITIAPGEGARCGAKGMTETYTVTGAAPAPALVPSLARPGEDIRIINLDPTTKTDVRIYSADGLIQNRYTVSGSDTYTIKAAGTTGFYLVELYNEGMKSTLRYIVK